MVFAAHQAYTKLSAQGTKSLIKHGSYRNNIRDYLRHAGPAGATAAAAKPHVAAQAILSGAQVCHDNTISSNCSRSASTVCFSNRIRRGRSEPQTAAAPSSEQQQHQQQHGQPLQEQPQQTDAQQQQQQQQQPILIALGTTSYAAAKAIIMQLHSYGSAEVWATSSANHFTALQALADAHCQLAEPSQQHQHQQPHGLAATAQLSTSDQAVADDQKRGLRKLTLHVKLTPAPLDEAVWAPGASNHLSTNRTRAVAELVEAMQVQLGPASSTTTGTEDSSNAGSAAAEGSSSSCGCVVLEARGEQAITRALKAVLSVQAVQQGTLLLAPWAGPVVDVVAEKRGEQRHAGGLLLHVSWQSAAA